MTRKMKSLLSIILVAVLCVSLLSLPAFAAEAGSEELAEGNVGEVEENEPQETEIDKEKVDKEEETPTQEENETENDPVEKESSPAVAIVEAAIASLPEKDEFVAELAKLMSEGSQEEADACLEMLNTVVMAYEALSDEERAEVSNADALISIVEAINSQMMTTELGNEISTAEELADAMVNGGEYVLAGNISISDTLYVKSNVTLNLAGYTINYSGTNYAIVLENGSLTVSGGEMTAPSARGLFYLKKDTKLNIINGKYSALRYLFVSLGCVTVETGEFSNTRGYSGYFYADSKTYIYGGTFNVVYGFAMINNRTATVETSSSLSATTMGNYTDLAYKLTEEEYDNPVVLVWGKIGENGPEMYASGPAVYGNFWSSETDITINSGKMISASSTAIYHPQQGVFTMNGGYLQGATGIEAKMGHFTFNGGYVVGTGAADDGEGYESILGGTTSNGSAMKFELYYYGAEDSDGMLGARGSANQQAVAGGTYHLPRNNDFSLNITDGVFISENNAPITVKNWNMCAQQVSYSVTGGRFSSHLKTVDMEHGENDGVTAYGVPVCDTVKNVSNYIYSDDYKFAPAAYYDGVALSYGFAGSDAGYYASMADAIADRNNDPDARAYIYYLLDNELGKSGSVSRQLQIFYNLDDCAAYIPQSLNMGTDGAVFGYSFDSAAVEYNTAQYVITDNSQYALWSPAVTFDANGGTFTDGEEAITVLATVASGLYDGTGYGYVVPDDEGNVYVTMDEFGTSMSVPESVILTIPADPQWGIRNFLGWFYEDGTAFDPSTTQIKENVTVYAKWSQLYTVTVNYINKSTGETVKESFVSEKINEGDSYDFIDKQLSAIVIDGKTYNFDSKDGSALKSESIDGDKVINLYYVLDDVLGDNEGPTNPNGGDKVLGDSKAPGTGDNGFAELWILAALISAIGAFAVVIFKKRSRTGN